MSTPFPSAHAQLDMEYFPVQALIFKFGLSNYGTPGQEIVQCSAIPLVPPDPNNNRSANTTTPDMDGTVVTTYSNSEFQTEDYKMDRVSYKTEGALEKTHRMLS